MYAAALSAEGPGRELILRGIRGEVELLLSRLVLEETRRNLSDKAPRALPMFEVFRQVMGARTVALTRAATLRVAAFVNDKDAPIVAAALTGRADYLATHDVKTLLRYKDEIKAEFGLTLAQPHEILAVLRMSQA